MYEVLRNGGTYLLHLTPERVTVSLFCAQDTKALKLKLKRLHILYKKLKEGVRWGLLGCVVHNCLIDYQKELAESKKFKAEPAVVF